MKPRFAKEIVNTKIKRTENEKWAHMEYSPVQNGIESVDGIYYWKGLRNVIESIEKAGFKVSISKDGKEYNQ